MKIISLNNLRGTIYSLNLFLTTLCAGFMTFYCIGLGRYFNFLLKNNLKDGFTKYYSLYRETGNTVSLLNVFLGTQMIIAIVSVILNFRKQPLSGQIIALLSPIFLMTLHFLTGFSESENLINSGSNFSDLYTANYLKYNIPLHIIYIILYAYYLYNIIQYRLITFNIPKETCLMEESTKIKCTWISEILTKFFSGPSSIQYTGY
jgi:hypothetical protein